MTDAGACLVPIKQPALCLCEELQKRVGGRCEVWPAAD